MESKENLKLGLLGVIAVTLIINTFFMGGNSTTTSTSAVAPVNQTNNIAPQTAPNPTPVPNPVQVPTGPTTSVSYAEEAYDFGNVKQDTENEHIFKFTNTGTEPMIISNAKGSCGCTVPQYPTEPIAPGETGEIIVVYKPGKQKGNQTKTVTVTANTTPAQIRLQISANVEEVPL